MGAFSDQDLKELVQLAGVIKRAYFKELNAGEIVAINKAIKWMETLHEKIETAQKAVAFFADENLKQAQLIAELDAKLKEPVKRAKK